ncbi:MAG: IS21 family transposase [Mycobacterium sp.]
MVNLYEELGSFRAVAEIVGCDHKTVKAHVLRHQARQPLQRSSVADPYREVIGAKLDATSGRITAKVLFRSLRAAGYTGSARTLRRAVAEERNAWRATQRRRVYRPWNSAPGDVLVVDWGHVGTVPTAAGIRPLSVFCAVLGWSRYRFVRFTTSQKFAALAGCLATCFEHLGGVPARVLFDNPKTVTTSFVAGQSVFNLELVRLAAHYPFSPVTAAAADPESKGKVEALVRYVKGDCVPADGFSSLDAANRWAQEWMNAANTAVHPETCAVPSQRLDVERQLLRPLRERPAVATGERRKVDKCSTVRIASARYSVPAHLVGEWVEVQVAGDEVRMHVNGAEVALHRLQAPGATSIDDAHYPTPPPAGLRALRPVTATEREFLSLGPVAEAYLRAAAAAGATRLPRMLQDVLDLARSHGRDPVVAALQRAVIFGRFGTEDLRSILAAGTALPPLQRGTPTQLNVIGAPAVPTRSLEAYAWPA